VPSRGLGSRRPGGFFGSAQGVPNESSVAVAGGGRFGPTSARKLRTRRYDPARRQIASANAGELSSYSSAASRGPSLAAWRIHAAIRAGDGGFARLLRTFRASGCATKRLEPFRTAPPDERWRFAPVPSSRRPQEFAALGPQSGMRQTNLACCCQRATTAAVSRGSPNSSAVASGFELNRSATVRMPTPVSRSAVVDPIDGDSATGLVRRQVKTKAASNPYESRAGAADLARRVVVLAARGRAVFFAFVGAGRSVHRKRPLVSCQKSRF